MSHGIQHDRAQLRQQVVNKWFEQFVEHELYDTDQYHQFCKRVKDKSELEIERIFRMEK
jgi:hypothetical protein